MNKSVLIIAAHPDDETLGMGGSIKVLSDLGHEINVLFLSSGVGSRIIERQTSVARKKSAENALRTLGCHKIEFMDFPDNRFDSLDILDVARVIERKIGEVQPEMVFTNHYADLNIDHRITCEATKIAVRPKSKSFVNELYFFEIPSSTGWNFGSKIFIPQFYVNISNTVELKIKALLEYSVELDDPPNARSLVSLEALSVYRGSSVGYSNAEAFEVGFIRKNIE
jgi:LmbE family N-acetylglucosaminyl deacetylase